MGSRFINLEPHTLQGVSVLQTVELPLHQPISTGVGCTFVSKNGLHFGVVQRRYLSFRCCKVGLQVGLIGLTTLNLIKSYDPRTRSPKAMNTLRLLGVQGPWNLCFLVFMSTELMTSSGVQG